MLFTSESVSEGHPDKLADRIADAVLDAFLAEDPYARVACETLLTRNLVVLAGEFGSERNGLFDEMRDGAPALVRRTLREVGYRGDFPGIDPESCEIRLAWSEQSPDIARGVRREDGRLGAGDQGMVFGFACDETPELMPLPIVLAHRLVRRQAELRKSGALPWLRPDAKSQVTVRYEGRRPVRIETVVLSTQHAPEVPERELREGVGERIVRPVVEAALPSPGLRILVNPTGRFVVGGPEGDTGLTGRKPIVDTYGGACPHGGGSFSGKDPTKVDRSAAYAARHLAKNLVAAGAAHRCTVQVAYAIGVPEPVSLHLDFHGTGREQEEAVAARVAEGYDLSPGAIIDRFDLRRPIYAAASAYGHFGREGEGFPWEAVEARGPWATSVGSWVGGESSYPSARP